MILVNESEPYKINFGNKEYSVPKGKFEVTTELGSHIINKSRIWDKKIYVHDTVKAKIEQTIIPEEIKEDKTEVSEENVTSEELPVDKKIDTDKTLKEAEEFLKGK